MSSTTNIMRASPTLSLATGYSLDCVSHTGIAVSRLSAPGAVETLVNFDGRPWTLQSLKSAYGTGTPHRGRMRQSVDSFTL
jgi:hypothetical protein